MPRPKQQAPYNRFIGIRLHKFTDCQTGERIDLTKFLDDNFTEYICAEERANRTHYHVHGALKWVDNKDCQNLVRALKNTICSLAGNEDYSIKKHYTDIDGNEIPCDERGYRYVCKGLGPDFETSGPNIQYSTFGPEDIRKFHAEWWNFVYDKQKRIDAKPAVIPSELKPKKKKMTRQTFTERVILHLRDQFKHHEIDFNPNHPPHRFMVLRTILDNMGRNTMQIDAGNIIVSRMYHTVVNGLVPLDNHSRRRQFTASYYETIFGSECPVVQHPSITLELPRQNDTLEI